MKLPIINTVHLGFILQGYSPDPIHSFIDNLDQKYGDFIVFFVGVLKKQLVSKLEKSLKVSDQGFQISDQKTKSEEYHGNARRAPIPL